VKIAVYPGSFDPITNGHLDIIDRALAVFDRVIVAVLLNPRKAPLLPADERVRVIREAVDTACPAADHVEVTTFEGLTVDAVRSRGAHVIVRGLRSGADFDLELQLAQNNRRIAPAVDTVLFVSAPEHGFISSSLVKEIAGFGGNVSGMIPPAAEVAVRAALGRR
jgi:pantetheine-phosphate adenylyltransferase